MLVGLVTERVIAKPTSKKVMKKTLRITAKSLRINHQKRGEGRSIRHRYVVGHELAIKLHFIKLTGLF